MNGRVPVSQPCDQDAVAAALAQLVRAYDSRWCGLDFLGLSRLWEDDDNPQPIYLGDEYAEPLIGAEEIGRHWARVGSRLKAAWVSSVLHTFDVLNEGIVRVVLLSRWRLTGRESDLERAGASWITWLLVRRDEQYRIVHQMESQVYLTDEASSDG